ncbi:hypothetical protein D3C81_1758880 [compost metagenome]
MAVIILNHTVHRIDIQIEALTISLWFVRVKRLIEMDDIILAASRPNCGRAVKLAFFGIISAFLRYVMLNHRSIRTEGENTVAVGLFDIISTDRNIDRSIVCSVKTLIPYHNTGPAYPFHCIALDPYPIELVRARRSAHIYGDTSKRMWATFGSGNRWITETA